MKKTTLVIFLFISIFLSACGPKTYFEFEFDNFYGQFFTKNNFSNTNIKAEGLGYSIIKGDIIKMYQATNSSGYKDNIIIIKKHTNGNIKDVVKLMESNVKTEGYKPDTIKPIQITCKNEKISAYYINAKVIGNLNTTYLYFSFLKQNEKIYIISFATQDESERNTFASDIKRLKCRE